MKIGLLGDVSDVTFFIIPNEYEPAHDKTYTTTCATSEDSDQPAHSRSLIRVFADRMCLLQHPGYPKRDTREPLPYWVDVDALLATQVFESLLATQVFESLLATQAFESLLATHVFESLLATHVFESLLATHVFESLLATQAFESLLATHVFESLLATQAFESLLATRVFESLLATQAFEFAGHTSL